MSTNDDDEWRGKPLTQAEEEKIRDTGAGALVVEVLVEAKARRGYETAVPDEPGRPAVVLLAFAKPRSTVKVVPHRQLGVVLQAAFPADLAYLTAPEHQPVLRWIWKEGTDGRRSGGSFEAPHPEDDRPSRLAKTTAAQVVVDYIVAAWKAAGLV